MPICASQPRLALGGAASISGSGSETDTIFSPNTSPSPQAIKPWMNENGLTAHVESSSTSVWSPPNTQWPVLSIFKITEPEGPISDTIVRSAVVSEETAGRLAPLKLTRFDMSVCLYCSLERAAVNCFPICKTAGRGSDSTANVSPDDTDTTMSAGNSILAFFKTFSSCAGDLIVGGS